MTGAIRRRNAMRTKKRKVMRKKARLYRNSYLFRRQAQLMRITQTAANTVAITDGNGCLSIGTTGADSMSNTIQWGNSYLFKLSSVIDSTDFTNLYDRYKINGIRLKIMYQADSASVGGLGVLPIFNYCPDYDDAAVPSSLNAVETKQKARSIILTANKPVSIFVKPKVASALYQSLLTGYAVSKAPFINSTYPDVQHYGLKTWINNFYAPAGANNQITIQATYYLSCKDPQ